MIRLTKIDETNISDHARLVGSDECYFLHEYTSGKGYDYKDNGIISNLKKSPLRSEAELKWKRKAIKDCAAKFASSLNPTWLSGAVLVPIPGSKALGHPEYDDRMTKVCHQIGTTHHTAEIVVQNRSTEAAHMQSPGSRISVEELLELYELKEPSIAFEPVKIAIIDDVLTAGTHFRAMHKVLSDRYPNAHFIGLFVARRIIQSGADPSSAAIANCR